MQRHSKSLIVLFLLCAGLAALVLIVCALARAPTSAARTGAVHLGEFVRVPKQPTQLCKDLVDADKGAAVMHLFVDGLDTGVSALKCEDELDPAVTFKLLRVRPDSVPPQVEAAAWEKMLGDPLDTLGGVRELSVDIGRASDAGGAHLAAVGATLKLAIFHWWAPVTLVGVLFVWLLTIYLGANSTLVRDPAPAGTPLANRTFSLGRTQFAWWFAIVFASLGFLWLVTGEVPAVSPQALGLLGISGATTGLAVAVDPGRLASDGKEGVFLHDLLSDQQGVTIHRFQMVVMTVALGLVFLYDVATRLTMPTFDASLLTMMGLSSAAYVGLKIPESGTPPASGSDPKAGYSPAPTSALPPIRPQ